MDIRTDVVSRGGNPPPISSTVNGHPGPVKMKMAYTITERGTGKSFWTKIGVGFVNQDGSITIRLDAIPVNGTLQLRDWEPRDNERRPDEGGSR